MNKRPKEIEEAMSNIDSYTLLDPTNTAIDAWDTVYDYITHLEYTIQNMLNAEERMSDDGK